MASVTDADVLAISGAFFEPDLSLFRVVLAASRTQAGTGDLAELGVAAGRAAVLIGSDRRDGEVFTVVDLFEAPADDDENQREQDEWYAGIVTRERFERAYRDLHGELPVVLQGQSAMILDHAAHGTHRFVHVDASHLYDHVAVDVRSAHTLLADEGVVVFDDFRTEHAPGVAAAVWPEVATGGLVPFALSPQKMYATWGDAGPYREAVAHWAASAQWPCETQAVRGHDVLRLLSVGAPAHRLARYVPPVLEGPIHTVLHEVRRRRSGA